LAISVRATFGASWLPNRRLAVSRLAITRELGTQRASKAGYKFIAQACHAMKNTS